LGCKVEFGYGKYFDMFYIEIKCKSLDFIGDGDIDAMTPDNDPIDNCSDGSHGNSYLI